MVRPGTPGWATAVQRAVELLRENPRDTLVNTCQNVPLKYLAQLRAEAKAL